MSDPVVPYETLIQLIYAGMYTTLDFWDEKWCASAFTEQTQRIRAGRAASWRLRDEVGDALDKMLGMRTGRQVPSHEVIDTRKAWSCGMSNFDHPRTHTFRTSYGKLRRAMTVHNYNREPEIASEEPFRVIPLPLSIYSPEHCTAYLIVQTDHRPDLTRARALEAATSERKERNKERV